MREKNNFCIFVLSDLKFSPIVTLVQSYVSTKLEVFKAFLFREIGGTGWTDGQTDGRVQHNAAGH